MNTETLVLRNEEIYLGVVCPVWDNWKFDLVA
jgi:hypothetical protein